jgi:hypothetical protein
MRLVKIDQGKFLALVSCNAVLQMTSCKAVFFVAVLCGIATLAQACSLSAATCADCDSTCLQGCCANSNVRSVSCQDYNGDVTCSCQCSGSSSSVRTWIVENYDSPNTCSNGVHRKFEGTSGVCKGVTIQGQQGSFLVTCQGSEVTFALYLPSQSCNPSDFQEKVTVYNGNCLPRSNLRVTCSSGSSSSGSSDGMCGIWVSV